MKRWTACLLTLLLLINFICVNGVQSVFAADNGNTVRIGLVSMYKDCHNITIHNSSVKLGYEVDGTFVESDILNSTTGFTFTPDLTYCYGSVALYSSYAAVSSAIGSIVSSLSPSQKQYVCAGIQGNGQYRIYVYGDSAITAASIAQGLETGGKVRFAAVENDMKYRVKLTWSEGSLIIDAGASGLYPQFAAATPNEKGVYVINLGERQYRGRVEIGRFNGDSLLTAVSVLNMEEYLYGVVACEMVPSWEMEALKAQAVCARSYAYALDRRSATFGAEFGYALFDTTQSQVYKGYGAETERTNEAVDATAGKMIYYNGIVVKAFFYSTSGGHTENCEDVWDVPLTYFRSRPDNTEFYQEKAPWLIVKTKDEVTAAVSNSGNSVGTVTGLVPQIKSASGRIYLLKVTGTGGQTTLLKEKVRTTFSLPSTKVKIIKYGDVPDRVVIKSAGGTNTAQISNSYIISGNGTIAQADNSIEQYIVISDDNLTNFPRTAPSGPDTYFFAGMGYGHGVGLSQSGAQSLALLGYDYEYIIHHYYNKVEIR